MAANPPPMIYKLEDKTIRLLDRIEAAGRIYDSSLEVFIPPQHYDYFRSKIASLRDSYQLKATICYNPGDDDSCLFARQIGYYIEYEMHNPSEAPSFDHSDSEDPEGQDPEGEFQYPPDPDPMDPNFELEDGGYCIIFCEDGLTRQQIIEFIRRFDKQTFDESYGGW